MIDLRYVHEGAHPPRRRLPTTPEAMREILKTRRFTNGADLDDVLRLYEKTAIGVLGEVKSLEFIGLQLDPQDEWRSPKRLARALNYSTNLQRLHLEASGLTDEHLEEIRNELMDGALPNLIHLYLMFNRFTARGIETIGAMLAAGSAPRLQLLSLLGNGQLGSHGVGILARVLVSVPVSKHLVYLDVNGSKMGSDAALSLAGAIRTSGSALRIALPASLVGVQARAAIIRAREATGEPMDAVEIAISLAYNAMYPLNKMLPVIVASLGRFLESSYQDQR